MSRLKKHAPPTLNETQRLTEGMQNIQVHPSQRPIINTRQKNIAVRTSFQQQHAMKEANKHQEYKKAHNELQLKQINVNSKAKRQREGELKIKDKEVEVVVVVRMAVEEEEHEMIDNTKNT